MQFSYELTDILRGIYMLDILWHHFSYEHEMQHVHIHAKCLTMSNAAGDSSLTWRLNKDQKTWHYSAVAMGSKKYVRPNCSRMVPLLSVTRKVLRDRRWWWANQRVFWFWWWKVGKCSDMYGGAMTPEMYRSECVSQSLRVHVAFTLFWKVNLIDVW